MSEYSANLVPLINYASHHGLAAEANATPRDWNRRTVVEPYATYFRALVTSPVGAELFDSAADDFGLLEDDLRYSILAETLSALDDETLIRQSSKILQLAGLPVGISSNLVAENSSNVRGLFNGAVIFDRLQRLGLVSNFMFDQDYVLKHTVNPDNGFEISFDELLGLTASYDPSKKSKEEMIVAFNQWADDPQSGRKVLRIDGIAFTQRDLAMRYSSGRRKGDEISASVALEKVEDYLATNSHELVVAYVEDLLFDRSPIGLQLFDNLSARGFRGMLFEGSEQIRRAYGLTLAAHGQIEQARTLALEPGTNYEDYAYIHLEVARSLRKNINSKDAIAVLDALREVDPILHFAGRYDPDEYIGMMGGSPLGFINERIAEEYALCGAFPKALEAYRSSRQYPNQTEPFLAQTAIELNQTNEYFGELLAFDANEHDTMFMVSRLSVVLLDKLNDGLALGERFADKYPDIAAQLPSLTQRLQEIRAQSTDGSLEARVFDETLVEMFTAVGQYDVALGFLSQGDIKSIFSVRAFGKVLTGLSRRGEYEIAIGLYDKWAEYCGPVTGFNVPKFNITVMGWALVHGRQDMFNRFYELLPDYKRSLALFSMLKDFDGQNLHIDDDLAARIMRSDFHGDKLAKSVAALGQLMMGNNAILAIHTHM